MAIVIVCFGSLPGIILPYLSFCVRFRRKTVLTPLVSPLNFKSVNTFAYLV